MYATVKLIESQKLRQYQHNIIVFISEIQISHEVVEPKNIIKQLYTKREIERNRPYAAHTIIIFLYYYIIAVDI